MKRFFTLAALFVSMISFAAPLPRAGRIIISNADNSLIQVRINGRSYNVDRQPLIINNLAGGRHQVQIFKSERKPYGFTRSRPVLIYNAAVYVDPSYIVDLNVNRAGKVVLGKSVVVRNGNRFDGNAYDNDRYDNNRNDDNRYDNRFDTDRNDYGKPGSVDERYNDPRKSTNPGNNNDPQVIPNRPTRPVRS
jgi:hypothetical protein